MAEWTRGVCITLVAAGRRNATSLWGCVLAMAVRGDHQGTPPAEATPIPVPSQPSMSSVVLEWSSKLGTLHSPCGVPRAQVQALALLMQCRSAAPLVVGWWMGVRFEPGFLRAWRRRSPCCTKPGSTQPLHPKSAPGQNLLAIYGTLPEQPPALSAPPRSTECC